MATPEEDIQQGEPVGDDTMPAFPALGIGEPPVIKSGGCELLEGDGARNPGCVATVKCDGPEDAPCGQRFIIDLLSNDIIACPKCGLRFTWILAVAEVDDDDVVYDVISDVFENNGVQVPQRDDDGSSSSEGEQG